MSDPALGLLMLALIVVVIMMGFATAFTLMGLGMFFGFIAFYDPSQPWAQNRVFDLMVQRTYGAMTNDVLISIPLFVLMGYVMERGALVDKMFYSIQLAFRRVPAALAVATLIVCTFWGIASGLVGAVVVLMGVIAFNPMLRAGTLWSLWWYVVLHQQVAEEAAVTGVQQLGTPGLATAPAAPAELGPPADFYLYFWISAALLALVLLRYYWRMDAARFVVL